MNILLEYKKPIFLILIGIGSIIALIISFNSYGKDYITVIISDLVKNQIEVIDKQYTEELKSRDTQIKNLHSRLSTSEKTYADIKKRVEDVATRINERKAPETSKDLRDRFNNLGYKSVN
jgi:hypothetical protein